MTKQTEAMKLALEALVSSTGELHLRLASPTDMQLIKNHKAITVLREALAEQPAQQEPYESSYNPNPVEYQYHYPDGSWHCSNGEVINGMRPDRARSLYALKDNT